MLHRLARMSLLALLAASYVDSNAQVYDRVSRGTGFNGSDEIVLTNRNDYMVRCVVKWTIFDSDFPNKSAVQDIGEDAALRNGTGGRLDTYSYTCDIHPEAARKRQEQERAKLSSEQQRRQEAERRQEEQRRSEQRAQEEARRASAQQAQQVQEAERLRAAKLERQRQEELAYEQQLRQQRAEQDRQNALIAQQQAAYAAQQRALAQQQQLEKQQRQQQRSQALSQASAGLMAWAARMDAKRAAEDEAAQPVEPESLPQRLAIAPQSVNECKVIDQDIAGTYVGPCSAGFAHGQGTASARDSYTGEFRYGMKHGNGVYRWADGAVFEGEYRNDAKYFGVIRFPPGHRGRVHPQFVGKGEEINGDYVVHGMYVDNRFTTVCTTVPECAKRCQSVAECAAR